METISELMLCLQVVQVVCFLSGLVVIPTRARPGCKGNRLECDTLQITHCDTRLSTTSLANRRYDHELSRKVKEQRLGCTALTPGDDGSLLFKDHKYRWDNNNVPSKRFFNGSSTNMLLFVLTVMIDVELLGAYKTPTASDQDGTGWQATNWGLMCFLCPTCDTNWNYRYYWNKLCYPSSETQRLNQITSKVLAG